MSHGRVVEITLKFEDNYSKRLSTDEIALCLAVLGANVTRVSTCQVSAKPAIASSDDTPIVGLPFYAIFYDDADQRLHVTPRRRIWKEAVDDAMALADSYGTNRSPTWLDDARRFDVMKCNTQGNEIAPQHGSSRIRSRTRWHIAND